MRVRRILDSSQDYQGATYRGMRKRGVANKYIRVVQNTKTDLVRVGRRRWH